MKSFSFPPSLVPPGMYRAVMPDGHIIKEASRENWYLAIKTHYKNNGYALPDNWKEYYQDQWCKTAPPGFCVHDNGGAVVNPELRITIDDLKHGMQVLWNITRNPDPLVSREVAVKRGAICAACPGNVDVPGCKPCIQLANTIGDIKGKGSTPSDSYLRVCAICVCFTLGYKTINLPLLFPCVEISGRLRALYESSEGYCGYFRIATKNCGQAPLSF